MTRHRTIVALLAVVAVLLGLNLLKPGKEVIAGMQASDILLARRIMIANDDGEPRVAMGIDLMGNGFILVNDHEGNEVFSVRGNKVTPKISHSPTPRSKPNLGRPGGAESAAQAEGRKRLRRWVGQMYSRLMEFKGTQKFRDFGFGRGGPYHGWLDAVQAARRLGLPFKDGVAVANLATLGMEYIEQFNGSDELIRVARAEIDAYLKVESEWRGVDIKTLRKLSGFLEIWGEYPKVRPR